MHISLASIALALGLFGANAMAQQACPPGAALRATGPAGAGCYVTSDRSDPDPTLFWTGFPIFSGAYGATIGFGGYFEGQVAPSSRDAVFAVSFIPVVGPFVMAGLVPQDEFRALSCALGGVQIAGFALMILSHVFPRVFRLEQRIALTGNGIVGVF